MSEWTHNICKQCYTRFYPNREPTTLTLAERKLCCFCAQPNLDGIYVREDPRKLLCQGQHTYTP
jgi:hypothetical protein